MAASTISPGDGRIQTTPLGFGCAGLFRAPGRDQRLRLLHEAYDAGIRHFDVAPMYGLGRAERELGIFARRRREKLTIATKFGITPAPLARSLSYVQKPMRQIFASQPVARDHARAQAATQSRFLYSQGRYDAAAARRGLERSLRALRTDYIDIFLLHDPLSGRVCPDELHAYLEGARDSGLIRSWGVAGGPGAADEVAGSFPQPVPVRQFRDDIFLRSSAGSPAGSTLITYGVLSGALTRLLQHLQAGDARRADWAKQIGHDCSDPGIAVSLLLRAAFRRNRSGAVLFSTTRLTHIRAAVAALDMRDQDSDPALDAFLHLIDTELRDVCGSERDNH